MSDSNTDPGQPAPWAPPTGPTPPTGPAPSAYAAPSPFAAQPAYAAPSAYAAPTGPHIGSSPGPTGPYAAPGTPLGGTGATAGGGWALPPGLGRTTGGPSAAPAGPSSAAAWNTAAGSGGGGLPPAPAPPERRGGSGRSMALAALVGALVAALVSVLVVSLSDSGTTTSKVVTELRPSSQLAGNSLDIGALLATVRPSVVAIKTGSNQGEAAGSGIALTDDGLILTNAHVIEGASVIEVSYSDGSTHAAKLVGALPDNDVALVKAEGVTGVTAAELGSSDAVQVGDDVVAIGNALGLGEQPTVTRGIVSALDRSIPAENITLDHLIQTDAAINPGNSGGPLVNAKGQVIGMNTAIIQNSQSLGFSLAIDEIKPLIEDIKAGRGATSSAPAAPRPFLGVRTTDISEQPADVLAQFGVTRTDGAFVVAVEAGSGADDAGLAPGDVIVEIDGQNVTGKNDVGSGIRGRDIGSEIKITVERAGDRQTLTATLGGR